MKTGLWTICIAVSAIVQSFAIPASAQDFSVKYGPDKFANVSYPAVGKIKLEEGTCEGWFKVGYLPDRKAKLPFFSPMTFFYVGEGKNSKIVVQATSLYSERLDRYTNRLWISGAITEAGFSVDYKTLPNWQKDTWHHVAFTWKMDGGKYDNRLYIDGKEAARQSVTPSAAPSLGPQDVLRVGATHLNSCYATVDEIKVSTVARSPEEIAKSFSAGLTRDRFTSILDRFENVKAAGKVTETLSEEGVKGTVMGAFKEVDGREGGRALQLHVVEE